MNTSVTNMIAQPGSAVTEWLRRPRKLLIDGEWVEPRGGKFFDVLDPANGATIASVAEGTKADIDDAVAAARRSFESGVWAKLSGDQRSKVLWRVADLLEKYADKFAEMETLQNGMPLASSRGSVAFASEGFRYFAGYCTRIYGHTAPLVRPSMTGFVYSVKEPVGVVGLITPWNGPLVMATWKIAPALAAGCSCVLKPPEDAPLTALLLGELLIEAGVPAGVVNIVSGMGGDAGEALTHHPDVDKISFTGSTATGKRIINASSGNLKRLTLELGGKSPFIIMDDADIDAAIPAATNAICRNAGQVCAAGSRLLVHRSRYAQVVEGITKLAAHMRVGSGFDPSTQMGPLISAKQLERVTSYIAVGREEGGEILTGGHRIGESGYFVQPTLIANVNRTMKLMREEVFGPVLAVSAFDDEEEAIKAANDTPYGLASYLWTKDHSKSVRVAGRIRAGLVWVNTTTIPGYEFAFGGYKQSGWGRENGPDAINAFLETKSVVSQISSVS
jgi:phenylacetaldehyde dehydrogenase